MVNMSEKNACSDLSSFIDGVLEDDEKQSLLDFLEYCKTNKMPVRHSSGCLWGVYFKGKRAALIQITIKGNFRGQYIFEDTSWIVSTCYLDYGSKEIEEYAEKENIKEIIWKNTSYCKGCLKTCIGNQPPGLCKKIVGKDFNKICLGGVAFKNPDNEAMDCVKKLLEIRKHDIAEAGKK